MIDAPLELLRRVPSRDRLAIVAVVLLSAILAGLLCARLSFTTAHLDLWFDSDSALVYDQVTNRWSEAHQTNNQHPMFSLLSYPLVQFQHRILGIDKSHAALAVLLASSSLCVAAMYAALRLLGRSVGVSLVYTGVFMASSCGLLFLGIYERLMMGALSVLACVIAFALHERRLVSPVVLTVCAAFSLGVTVTNFMVGGLALLLARGWRRGVQSAANAVVVVVLASNLSSVVFPMSRPFPDIRSWPLQYVAVGDERGRLAMSGTWPDALVAFCLYSAVLPTPGVARGVRASVLSLQPVDINGQSATWYLAAGVWAILLACGLVRSAFATTHGAPDALVLLGIVSQFSLFMVFGNETVLYAPYYLPLLILVASKPWPHRHAEGVFAVGSCLFLLLLSWNNAAAFDAALRLARALM